LASRLIQVFEHDYLKVDDDDPKGLCTKHWKELSGYNERNKKKFYDITAKGVKFSQYVGAIQVGNTTIEILPKIDKSIPDDDTTKSTWHTILMKMLKVCHRLKTESLTEAHLRLRSNSILDWYIEIFLNEVQSLMHQRFSKKVPQRKWQLLRVERSIAFQSTDS